MQQSKIKILVGYHKPSKLIKNNIYIPMHLGRELINNISKDGYISNNDYNWMLDNMIGDNEGNNISKLNRYLCEITMMYWAWKNYDKINSPEYIGFCHYRRFLDFSNNNETKNDYMIYEDELSDEVISKYLLKEDKIDDVIKDNDIIYGTLTEHKDNVLNQFKELENIEYGLDNNIYLDILNYIRNNYKEYNKSLDIYLKSYKHYWYNCSVMKKDIFFRMCEFIFPILLKYVKEIDFDKYNVNGQRILAYVSERLIGLFITKEKLEHKKIDYRPIVYINNADINKPLEKLYDNQLSIVFSSDNNYIPYLAATIKSLELNSSKENKYVVYILNEDNISRENVRKIKSLETCNLKIEFISVTKYISKFDRKIFHISDHFTTSTYFRFFIPEIFKNFKKILYCDCDAIFMHDPSEVFDVDLQDKLVGAVKDTEVVRQIFTNPKDTYYSNILKLKEPYNYFQCGFLLLNIPELIAFNFTDKCIDTLIDLKNPRYVDQCVLNKVLENKVKFLDGVWNIENHLKSLSIDLKSSLPYETYIDFEKNILTPYFMHYTGYMKPWLNPKSYNAELFWYYARLTPFFVEIIYQNAYKFEKTILNLTPKNTKTYKNFLQRIFSIKNISNGTKRHKLVTILGVKIKFKKK